MKKVTLSEIFCYRNVSRVIAVLLALALLTFAGCTDNGDSSDNSSNVDSVQSSEITDSSDNNEDASSSDKTVSSNKPTSNQNAASSYINPLDGDITIDYDVKSVNIRSDINEVTPTVDPSAVAYDFDGYAKTEADALRKEILNTKNTTELYDIKGKIYYVSPGGDNENDGTSPEKAIKTIDAIDGLPLENGDAVLFERNSVYRMYETFYLKSGITYGSYGEGRKPIILGSAMNFAEANWQPSQKRNVWKLTYMYNTPCAGFFNQGEVLGCYKLTLRAVAKNGDFYYDESMATLYVYSDKGNPSNVWDSIEFSQFNTALTLGTSVSNVTVDNICIRYCGAGGVSGLYNNHNLTVTNCEIGFTGGKLGSSGVRLGNGIGTWCGGHDLKWDHNWVYQTFDSAISPQGSTGELFYYDNISICDNLLEYNNADIEWWSSDNVSKVGQSRFKNFHMDRNICRFTSLGWGTRLEDGGIRGIDGVMYAHTYDTPLIDVTWNDNIIDCPGRMIMNFSTTASSGITVGSSLPYTEIERKNNTFYIKESIRSTQQLITQLTTPVDSVKSYYSGDKATTLASISKIDSTATVHWYE